MTLSDSVRKEPTKVHPFTHPTYRAPEGLLGIPWTTKVDLWTLGTLVGGNDGLWRTHEMRLLRP